MCTKLSPSIRVRPREDPRLTNTSAFYSLCAYITRKWNANAILAERDEFKIRNTIWLLKMCITIKISDFETKQVQRYVSRRSVGVQQIRISSKLKIYNITEDFFSTFITIMILHVKQAIAHPQFILTFKCHWVQMECIWNSEMTSKLLSVNKSPFHSPNQSLNWFSSPFSICKPTCYKQAPEFYMCHTRQPNSMFRPFQTSSLTLISMNMTRCLLEQFTSFII
jgi:hypothetical protein